MLQQHLAVVCISILRYCLLAKAWPHTNDSIDMTGQLLGVSMQIVAFIVVTIVAVHMKV